MELGLQGRTAVVAGASGGIGKAIAEAFALEGTHVWVIARREEKLRELTRSLADQFGIRARYCVCDLNSESETRRTARRILEECPIVDVLVTNNGGPPPGGFEDLGEEEWLRGYNRTLMSTVRLIQEFLPGMKEQRFGRIINITSIAVKQPIQRLLLSNAFRAAVTGMAKTLSGEIVSSGITVNNIAPGYIHTNRLVELFTDRAQKAGVTPEAIEDQILANIPAGALGDTGDIASLAVFLASERAGYITGATIQVDGGLHKGLM
jgi:3-oxoacyl-[acyl-carrier protein] reductase